MPGGSGLRPTLASPSMSIPLILCWGLIGLGLIITIQGFITTGEPMGHWAWRSLFWVTVGILAFAVLLEPLGLVVATLALLMVSAIGSPEARWLETAIFSVGMTVFGVVVFVYGLGLTLKMLPF